MKLLRVGVRYPGGLSGMSYTHNGIFVEADIRFLPRRRGPTSSMNRPGQPAFGVVLRPPKSLLFTILWDAALIQLALIGGWLQLHQSQCQPRPAVCGSVLRRTEARRPAASAVGGVEI